LYTTPQISGRRELSSAAASLGFIAVKLQTGLPHDSQWRVPASPRVRPQSMEHG
jgi:hypothetical protein